MDVQHQWCADQCASARSRRDASRAIGYLGKIKTAPETLVIDGQGLHVTPGLIDAHSHTAILGGVNEGTLPSSAMVRISDVVNSETDTLYQQLAGGVTAVNLLHGSANPIGGQSCVIKLRDGASPERPNLRRRATRHQVRAGGEREAVELGRQVCDALSPNPHGGAHFHRQPLHRRP